MERLNAHVGSFQGTLQETPEVFEPVGVDLSVHVCLGMVNDAVNVATLSHPVIGAERIGVESRTGFNVFSDDLLKLMFLAVGNDLGPHLARNISLSRSSENTLKPVRLSTPMRSAPMTGWDSVATFTASLTMPRHTWTDKSTPTGSKTSGVS